MQPKPIDIHTLSLAIGDALTRPWWGSDQSKSSRELIAEHLIERGLINLDVLNKHRKSSKLRAVGQ